MSNAITSNMEEDWNKKLTPEELKAMDARLETFADEWERAVKQREKELGEQRNNNEV